MPRPSDVTQVTAAQLRIQVLELRTLGQTLEQIGAKIGRSKGTVSKMLAAALDDLAKTQTEAASRYRALAYARLEKLLARSMLLGAQGNLKAMEQARKLILAQSRLLGLDAPTKHAFTDPTGQVERQLTGAYVIPVAPDTTVEAWQAAAQRLVDQQNARAAEAEGS